MSRQIKRVSLLSVESFENSASVPTNGTIIVCTTQNADRQSIFRCIPVKYAT